MCASGEGIAKDVVYYPAQVDNQRASDFEAVGRRADRNAVLVPYHRTYQNVVLPELETPKSDAKPCGGHGERNSIEL